MSQQNTFKTWGAFVSALAITALSACNTATTESESSAGGLSTVFPSTLAVASPYSYEEASASSVSALIKASTTESYVSSYSLSTAEIEAILSASSTTGCTFDPEDFLTQTVDAGCYGPTLDYENHPDSTGGTEDGELPSGDLGMWSEVDEATGNACAAAQLNARMDGLASKTGASLKSLASMVCVVNTNGLTLPTSSTLDITTEMNALSISDTTFNSVELTHQINADGNDQYTYLLDFSYTSVDVYDVAVTMDHVPTASADEYQGRLNYQVNSYMTGGNCPSRDITVNGSVLYESTSATNLILQAREASFCGHDANGLTDGIVDPSLRYEATSTPNGWGNNFSIFSAEIDPSSMVGNYVYTWQAGPGDSNGRTFNLNIDSSNEGVAFFGYTEDIEDTDGSLTGFVCNWAGPNGNHAEQDYAQKQEMTLDTTTGLINSDSANIAYAPTNSCDYDGTGAFSFDTDFDGLVDSDPAAVFANELLPVSDGDLDGVFDEIDASGFDLPTTPDNI